MNAQCSPSNLTDQYSAACLIKEISNKWSIVVSWINNEDIVLTLLDIKHIGNLGHDEIIEILNRLFNISITSPEWIEKMNQLAQQAYGYMQSEMFYTESELKNIGNIQFNDSQDVIQFLQWTKKSNGIYKCILAQIAFCYVNAVGNTIEWYREKSSAVLLDKVLPNLQDMGTESSLHYQWISDKVSNFKNTGAMEFQGSIYHDIDWENWRKINFQVKIREKSIVSSISKAIREKDYINQWNILDFLWMTIICENKDDQVIIMNLLSQLAFKYGKYRIKNKWWVTKDIWDEVLSNKNFQENKSNEDFIEVLEESFKVIENRISTAIGYKDVKIIPDENEKNKLRFETMFLTKNEYKNNSRWLANHSCFEHKRKIAEHIRLDWYIKKDRIQTISRALLDTISEDRILLEEIFLDIMLESKWNILARWTSPKNKKHILHALGEISKINEQKYNITHSSLEQSSVDEAIEEISIFEQEQKDIILAVIQSYNDIELKKQLENILPDFYISGLIAYPDSNGNISSVRKKYTNKIWMENISALSPELLSIPTINPPF